jgi:hypothetical protein
VSEPDAVRAPRLRARVHEALVCPYCRDTVKKRGTLACARRGCGALYHRECWEECSSHYGGCAVFGCESKRAKEVSAAGYLWKLARVLLAALIFPPRLVRALAQDERTESERKSLGKRSLAYAALLNPMTASGVNALVCFLLYLGALPAVFSVYLWIITPLLKHPPPWTEQAPWAHATDDSHEGLAFLIGAIAVLIAVFLPVPVGFLLALGFNVMKLVSHVLRGEVASLGRADEGGTTVLGRLRSGEGKKREAT